MGHSYTSWFTLSPNHTLKYYCTSFVYVLSFKKFHTYAFRKKNKLYLIHVGKDAGKDCFNTSGRNINCNYYLGDYIKGICFQGLKCVWRIFTLCISTLKNTWTSVQIGIYTYAYGSIAYLNNKRNKLHVSGQGNDYVQSENYHITL